jgi:hypothetical protein
MFYTLQIEGLRKRKTYFSEISHNTVSLPYIRALMTLLPSEFVEPSLGIIDDRGLKNMNDV